MSEKRRDSKGRVLRTGESQRPDGRYTYKYIDATGKPQFVYSWKLEPRDGLPQGKHNDLSLREKIKQIKRDLEDGINPRGGEITVLELVEKYLRQRPPVRANTMHVRDFVAQVIERTGFGVKRIDRVKESDAKEFLIQLQEHGRPDGTGYNRGSIEAVAKVLRPAFKMAVKDDLIRKNPFDFKTSDAIGNNSKTREALTLEQEREYLEFVKKDAHFSQYYDALYILFHTGLRISEFAGLTMADVDMDSHKIVIDHQLLYDQQKGYYISDTKTVSGKREIPMSDDVYIHFQRLIASRPTPKIAQIIDGKYGFFFLGEKGMPLTGQDWANRFRGIWTKFSKANKKNMPKVTPHICRHTFCSNMAKNGMNPKALQYIMGHANVSITLDTYTHVGFQDAEIEMRRIANGG
jgi:integrase